MKIPYYALSVHQPMAALICSGLKKIEVRSWTPPYELEDTLKYNGLLICSTQSEYKGNILYPEGYHKYALSLYSLSEQKGMALCVVSIYAYTRFENWENSIKKACIPFVEKHFSWHIREEVMPIVPFPVKGRQRLWKLTDKQRSMIRGIGE